MRRLFFVGLLGVLAGCTGTDVLNTLASERGYTVAANLAYGPESALRLDVYSPEGVRNAPVVVFFYGGRWSSGSKDEYKFVGQALASRRFVAVLPDYRHYPAVRFPAFVHDAARAMAWTHAHIGEYGGDPDRLFVMGHSSGAHLAAMLALSNEYLDEAGGSRAWLSGMIGLAGPYDFLPLKSPDLRDMFGPPDAFEKSQPIFHVDGQNPPLLLMHGEDDEVVRVENTRKLASAVAKAGGPVETVLYEKLSHERIVGSLGPVLRARADVLDQVTAFVRKHAKARGVGPAATPTTTTPLQTTPLETSPWSDAPPTHMDVQVPRAQDAQERPPHMDVQVPRAQDAQERPPEELEQ